MRDIDSDIRNSLERLTDPQGNTPSTESVWGDLVDRRRKRRNRNRIFAALPLLLVAVLAAGVLSTRDSSDGTRSDVAAGDADPSSPDGAEPTVTVSVNEMPFVEAFTSPLTPSDQAWLQHTVTIRNTGAEPLALSDFRSGEVLGDDEVAVATEGCTFNGSTTVGCHVNSMPPLLLEPGATHEFTVHVWRDLPGMNPVTGATYAWDLPVQASDRPIVAETDANGSLTVTYDSLNAADMSDEAATGTLRVRNIQVFGNGPEDGGTERAVIVFNEPLRAGDVQYVSDISMAVPAAGMAWTTQGPNGTHLCDSQHSVPDGAVGSVDLLVPASWFADADAHAVTELATTDDPAKFPICGPHNGFIQYAMWSPLTADPAEVFVTVSPDRTTVTVEVMPAEQAPLDRSESRGHVGKFLATLLDGDFEAAAMLWSGYPVSEPDRPISDRVQYVEQLAEYPPFARIVASDNTTTFVTPSTANHGGHVVTVLDPRSGDSPPVAVAFLTGLSGEGDDERMWIQRIPPIDANATPELPNDGYVQPGERVVVPGLPVEGGVRGFVNGDEIPVEVDLGNETFTVVVPPGASGDIAVTLVVATPEEPIVRTFAATVR